MRRLVLLSCAAALVGCAKSEEKPADTTPAMAAPAPPPAPKAIAYSDVAGTWNVKGLSETGDSTIVTYVLKATATDKGWTINLPNRKPIPVHVMPPTADSIVIHAGPYASVLRKGVQVKTTGTIRVQDGKLVGMTKAQYSVKTADSVRMIRMEGTKAP